MVSSLGENLINFDISRVVSKALLKTILCRLYCIIRPYSEINNSFVCGCALVRVEATSSIFSEEARHKK